MISHGNKGTSSELVRYFHYLVGPDKIPAISGAQMTDEFTHYCAFCERKLHTKVVDFEAHSIMHADELGITQQMAQSWRCGGSRSNFEVITDERHKHLTAAEARANGQMTIEDRF